MARISKDQLRQLITDGGLSRSPYPKRASVQPLMEQETGVPSVQTRGRPVRGLSTQDQLKDYLASKRAAQKTSVGQSSDPTQMPVAQPSSNPQAIRPRPSFPTAEEVQKQASIYRQQMEQDRIKAAEEADKFLNQYMPGLTPEQRKAYEESADLALNREMEAARRMLSSQTGARGIQGGAAQIPRTELARYGIEAKQQFQRDLAEMDAEKAMDRLIAKLALQEGLVGQNMLATQQAEDYLSGRKAADEQQSFLDRFYRDYFGAAPGDDVESEADKLIKTLEQMGFKVNKKKTSKSKKRSNVGSRI